MARRARDMATRGFDNLGDPLEHFLFSTIAQLCHDEAVFRRFDGDLCLCVDWFYFISMAPAMHVEG